MADEAIVFEVLSALASIQGQLIHRAAALSQVAGTGRTVHGLSVFETREDRVPRPRPPGIYVGLRIAAFVALHQDDGSEVEWYALAINGGDGSGWKVEREVDLNGSLGEPVTLASTELPVVTLTDSLALAHELPSLVEELLALPVPRPSEATE